MLSRIVTFIHERGSAAGIQLAHAGRKGSTAEPWNGGKKVDAAAGGWEPVGPTTTPFAADYPTPRELSSAEIADVIVAFRRAAVRDRVVLLWARNGAIQVLPFELLDDDAPDQPEEK